MKQQFSIVLEGADGVTPVVVRLRQALKLLGRVFKLRCVEAREVGRTEGVELRDGDFGTGCVENSGVASRIVSAEDGVHRLEDGSDE